MRNIIAFQYILSPRNLPLFASGNSMTEHFSFDSETRRVCKFYKENSGDSLESRGNNFLMTRRNQMDDPSDALAQCPEVMGEYNLSGSPVVPVLIINSKPAGEMTCKKLIQAQPVKKREVCCAFSKISYRGRGVPG